MAQTRTHNAANEMQTASGWVSSQHDAAGNMTRAPRPGQESTAAEALLTVYDAWNRPAKVYKDTNANGSLDVGTDALVAEYRYDGRNYRITKLLPNGNNWDRTDYYYNEGWQCLEERFAGNQANKETVATAAKYQYIWDVRYIDAPVLRDADTDADGDCTDSGGSERLYYTNDANMNVTALVNTSGTVVERYVYSPYGQPEIYDGSWAAVTWDNSKKNEILYCGYRYDPETGMYQVRNREYHPALGRWRQRDADYYDGMNLYEYSVSSPADVLDSFGLKANVTWVEPNKPEDAQPEWKSQEDLDKGVVTPEDKALGLEHCDGSASNPICNGMPGYGYYFKQGCCFCWFDGTLTVSIDYYFSLLNDLKDPKTDKEKARRKRAEDHERGHLAEDAAIPFRDLGLRKPLIDEVAAHDTQKNAYQIDKWSFNDPKTGEAKSKGISTREQCKIGCGQYLLGVIDQKLEPMRQAVKSRGAARDERDYRADARKRAAEKQKAEKQ